MKTIWIKTALLILWTIVMPKHVFSSNADNANYTSGLREELSALCKGIENSRKCAEIIERHQFKKGVKGITRRGNKLIVKMRAGKTLAFKDSEEDDTAGKWYQYLDYLKNIKCHLIHVQLYEDIEYILIHIESGKKYILKAIPIISPDNSHFATVDICDNFCSNQIRIYIINANGISVEYMYKPEEYWLWTKFEWISNDNIRIRTKLKGSGYNKNIGPEYVDKVLFIVREGNIWNIKE